MLLLVRYHGDRKINGIKAVRCVFGIGLKEAKDAVEHKAGFITTEGQFIRLSAEYAEYTDTHQQGLDEFDFSVEEYDSVNPMDLSREGECKDRTATSRRRVREIYEDSGRQEF